MAAYPSRHVIIPTHFFLIYYTNPPSKLRNLTRQKEKDFDFLQWNKWKVWFRSCTKPLLCIKEKDVSRQFCSAIITLLVPPVITRDFSRISPLVLDRQISGDWDQTVLECWKRSRLPLARDNTKFLSAWMIIYYICAYILVCMALC